MKSKILDELVKVTECTQKRGESDQDYLKRLIKATSDLGDGDWNKLSADAQNWFNDAADSVNAKKDLPAFPDAEDEKAETTTRRRRAAADESAAPPADDVAVGDDVDLETARGQQVSGKVVEIDDKIVVIDNGKEELEYNRDRLKSLTKKAAPETSTRRRRAAEDEAPETPAVAEPKVGDEVSLVTGKGVEYSGKIVEVGDDLVVIDTGKEELEFTASKLKSLVIAGAKAEGTSRRRASGDGDSAAKDTKEKGAAAKDKGPSATGMMRDLICSDFTMTQEEIGKKVTAAKLEYRPATLGMVFVDTHKVITALKAAGKLK